MNDIMATISKKGPVMFKTAYKFSKFDLLLDIILLNEIVNSIRMPSVNTE
jgi:hypothetical protein